MKKRNKLLSVLLLVVLLAAVFCTPAFAVTESEVEAQVAASSKGEVAGNVLIWFLCAIAFLKVSQKIDSFMASLGVNVGHTGGSLLAEAMIAMRGVTMVAGAAGHGGGRRSGGSGAAGSGPGNPGSSGGSGWFLKGGLAGAVSRHVTNSAAKTATTQTSAVHTAQRTVQGKAAGAAAQATGGGTHVTNNAHTVGGDVQAGGVNIHGGGSAVDTAPQEGVIVTGEGPQPVVTPPGGAPAPDGSTVDGAAPIISQAETVSAQESVSLADGGTVLNIPQDGGGAPAAPLAPPSQEGVIVTGGETRTNTQSAANSQTAQSSTTAERSHTASSHSQYTRAAASVRPSLGGAIFSKSLAAGGSFANNVIGTVARGEVTGSITGDMAAQSLASYMGYTALGEGAKDVPQYSGVEIGHGRITGMETAPGGPGPLPFAMYHADQYAAPTGEFQKVFAADGTAWFKQYAQDAVERKPYMAPDDTVAYHEKIVKKLPDAPKRKDRM